MIEKMNDYGNDLGLYREEYEQDSCGVGFISDIKGRKSHQTVSDALTILENMEHRGACGCDPDSGDGAGILMEIPHDFLAEEVAKDGITLPEPGQYALGLFFLPKRPTVKETCKKIIEEACGIQGMEVLGFRKVPVDITGIGETALSVEPDMEQLFLKRPDALTDDDEFERKLFVLKARITKMVLDRETDTKKFYVATLSARKTVYKGQLRSIQVRNYFPDLGDKRLTSAYGMVHSRFSTNTSPSWKLAQPFRFMSHNGEINTIVGNLNWFYSSMKSFVSPYFTEEEMELLLPVVERDQSDSACLDNVVELLAHAGRSLPHVMMMLIPEAWDGNDQMSEEKKAFYKYHATLMAPWDGPAAVTFTDGNIIGATLDRNGLRPLRYAITSDDKIVVASEAGALPIDETTITKKGRLQPGKMLVVDIKQGKVVSDEELKTQITSERPYGEWLKNSKIELADLDEPRVVYSKLPTDAAFNYQQVFGYTSEDLESIIKPMALDAKEPTGAMGADMPLAVLSDKPQHLSNYFKQLFAQVTNPPIDPIRERLVMSLAGVMGNNGNLLDESRMQPSLFINQPVLKNNDLEKIRTVDTDGFQAKTLQTYFNSDGKPGSLKKGLDRLCAYAEDAVNDGFEVLILSDRTIDSEHAAIPSLLAVSAVHHHLIRKGIRGAVGIIVEAGDVWEIHHYATLVGFGATAINPYLALASIRKMQDEGIIPQEKDLVQLQDNYVTAVCNGLLKVFSKMGISTLQSYHGAQIFEIVGFNEDVVKTYFNGSVSRIGGLGLDDIAKEALLKHFSGFKQKPVPSKVLPKGGVYQWKRTGEAHLFNPDTIHLLQESTSKNNYETYKKYSELVNNQKETMYTIRGLLDFVKHRPSIDISEVEPAENIMKRFATGAMSFGSISHEAHSTLAIAMNRIGAKSNTGEGGEDIKRYTPMENGDSMRSAIKQIASGRFGVTANYLTNADELQIKMAQGAKPGEGGQLPGHKVDDWIAQTRNSTPGVGLISPPPHHDIYSIEDLAQLIYDLKNSNRAARINVKLVSKAGVGTIASGVAKAHSDVILIAGHDGGTGASPMTSIVHAGLPWELGLAETQQSLVKNKLRSRVVVQADGQMKTGRDIAIATLLGAEEWGVATAALVVEGCIMMRKCHLNTCPVGIATQDKDLRKLFTGKPEHVVNLFKFIAEEMREIMAELGFKTVNEMVGHSSFLKLRDDIDHWKVKNIDLTDMLVEMENPSGQTLYNSEKQDHELDRVLDWKLLEAAKDAIDSKKAVTGDFNIINTDRTTGTILSNEVTKVYGVDGLPENTINFNFTGSAGQSFGAFCTKGLTFKVNGEANDYVGKGLSGARLAVAPAKGTSFTPNENMIIGNVALYGATDGELYVGGMAGERFAVRNSGATTVVEGIGDHGCEYMTGGKVLVIGPTGRNFAAGMSGGIAWIYDVNKQFESNCNPESIDIDPLTTADEEEIQTLLKNHIELTGSAAAKYILDDWKQQSEHFIKVFPKEYKAVLAKKENKKQKVN